MLKLSSPLKLVFLNSLSSVIQVIIISLSFFILYRIIIENFGTDLLGVWSLILATTSFANISNLGFSASLVKFVANFNATNNSKKITLYIQTAYISVAILIGIISLFINYLSFWVLPLVIPKAYLKEALLLLPWSLFCLWVNGVGGIFMSVLDGFQLIYQKNLISILSSFILIIISLLLIEKGLLGIAYAQLAQSLFILIGSIFLVYKKKLSISFLRLNWKKEIFKEMFNYGGKIQIISLLNLLWEPTTKYFFSFFGDLSSLGIYEMASRLVTQIKSIIVLSNQSIVPYIASKVDLDKFEISKIYYKNIKIILFLSIPIMSGIICFAPFISEIWIGHLSLFFICSISCLSIAWTINIFAAPAYFINVAKGNLHWVIITHLIYSFINPMLCLTLGFFYSSYGLLLAICISLISGSLFTIITFHKHYSISLSQIISFKDFLNFFLLIGIQLFSIYFFFKIRTNELYIFFTISVIFYFLCYAIYLKNSSLNKDIIKWIFRNVSK